MIEPIKIDPKLVEMLRKSIPMTLAESIDEILKKPVIADVILVGVTDAEGIQQMKEEGFVPLGLDGDAVIEEELHHGTESKDRQAGGSEDQAQG
jgi:hypothetical protein